MYKNTIELKKDRDNFKMRSTFFDTIYNTIINAMCDGKTELEYTQSFTKLDVQQLRGLGFIVDIVVTHGILGSGRNEKVVIKWT